MFRRTATAVAAFIAAVSSAAAHDFKAGEIEIGHPWSRPTPPSAPVASGYMTLTNSGTESDRLVEISSPLAERAEIHRSTIEDGVVSMRPADGLPLEPGATVDFVAEKLHVMFIGPQRQLMEGERFPAILVFEKAGTVEVEFVVQRRAGEAAPEGHSGHGGSN